MSDKVIYPEEPLQDSRVRNVDAPLEPKESVTAPVDKNTDLVIDYKSKNSGIPYAADLFDSRYLYNDAKADFDTLDEWVNMELSRLHLIQNKDAYRSVVNKLSKKIGIDKYAEPLDKARKLGTFLKKAVEFQKMRRASGEKLLSIDELYGS